MFWGKNKDVWPTLADFKKPHASTRCILENVQNEFPQFGHIYSGEKLFGEVFCIIMSADKPLYFDDVHLLDEEARLITTARKF
jgi:hypothetical protein